MKKKLFQFAVLFHEEWKVGEDMKTKVETKMIVEPKTILATDEKSATLKIAKELPEEYMDRLENIEILLRPF